jgi:preprotein translocase subunit SecA
MMPSILPLGRFCGFPLGLPWWPRVPIAEIRSAAADLAALDNDRLRQVSVALRTQVLQEGPDSQVLQIRAFALMSEALQRTLDIRLYDVQLHAGLALARGCVAEMQTGEGKTLACAPAACLHGLRGRGVHIATANAYLAGRDYDWLSPAFRAIGLSVGLLTDSSPATEKRAAYRCDVTYGTGYEFGFDYLRDQLTLRSRTRRPLGHTVWAQLSGADSADTDGLLQRGLCYAIVDEVDNVLLDDADSPLVLSAPATEEASDAEAHRLARRLLPQLVQDRDFHVSLSSGFVQLTPAGMDRIHDTGVSIPISTLMRTWAEYVESAIRAEYLLRRDVHYVVTSGAVRIVDESTGRIFSDRSWQDGLHQAVEAKESLPLTAERQPLAQITRQRFYRLYDRLSGMSGTAATSRREFRQVYGLAVESIPLRLPARRDVWPARFFASAEAKWTAIARSVQELYARQRPVLIGTRSIHDSECLADVFRQRGLNFELLNGRQDAAEALVVARAGQAGAITIATNLAGRGTDIRLGPNVSERGGLHVILSEYHDADRIDRQLMGRCARQGDPGSTQTFVSADDALIQRLGPWLATAMRRHSRADGELTVNLVRPLRRLQRMAERQNYASRCALLRRDLARDGLLCR